MNRTKMFALTAAIIMLAVAGIAIIDNASESDATVAQTGKMDVFFWNGTSWGCDLNITAYDGCIALQNSHFNVTYTNSSAATTPTTNDHQTIGIYSATYDWTYYYPNAEYGQFSVINNTGSQASDWSIFINIGNSTTQNWVKSSVEVGWLKPFEDYAAVVDSNGVSCATANIAIVYGTVLPSGSDSIQNYITNNSLTLQNCQTIDTTQGSAYEYKFHLQADASYGINIPDLNVITYNGSTYGTGVLNATTLNSGITIVGYGSDANLALKQALGSYYLYQNVAPSIPNNTGSYDYYSWVQSIFGLSDHYTALTDSWDYWYTYSMSGFPIAVEVPFDFNLGYYSNFTDGYYGAPDTIYLKYCSYYYSQN